MRVISGSYKGRKLKALDGKRVRPTSDKVKEAIFSIAAPYMGDGIFLDLCSGSGAIAIEALSRSEMKAVLIDDSRDSMKIARENLQLCGALDRAKLVNRSLPNALDSLLKEGIMAEIIFLDPPYDKKELYTCTIEGVLMLDLLDKQGIMIIEHNSGLSLLDKYCYEDRCLNKIKERKYGATLLSIFRLETSI